MTNITTIAATTKNYIILYNIITNAGVSGGLTPTCGY